MAARRPKARLFGKYAGVFVGVVCAAVIVTAVAESFFWFAERRRATEEFQQTKATLAAALAEQYVDDVRAELSVSIRRWLAADVTDVNRRRQEYRALFNDLPSVITLRYLDPSGREQLSMSRLQGTRMRSGVDRSRDPEFVRARAEKVYIGPVYFVGGQPRVKLALAEAGVTVAEVDLIGLNHLIAEKVKGATVYLTDAKGRLLMHGDTELLVHRRSGQSLPQVPRALRGRPGTDWRGTSFDGTPVVSSSESIPSLGWYVFVEEPLDRVRAPLRAALQRSGVLLLLSLAAASAVALLMARRLAAPIEALRAGADRLVAGDLERRLELRTGDELEVLADEFNVLAAGVRKSVALERELELARHVQARLIPTHVPRVPGMEAAGWTQPTSLIGGDCFDLWRCAGGDLGIFVGDASGHGLGPALIVAQVRALVRVLAEIETDPHRLLGRVNARLAADLEPGRFVTAFLAFCAPDGTLRWSSAGHGPVFLRGASGAPLDTLDPPAMPLGVTESWDWEPAPPTRLEPGGMLALFSDGVFEAAGTTGELFGIERVTDLLRRHADAGTAGLVDAIRADLHAWQGHADPTDDQTLVIVQRTAVATATAPQPEPELAAV